MAVSLKKKPGTHKVHEAGLAVLYPDCLICTGLAREGEVWPCH